MTEIPNLKFGRRAAAIKKALGSQKCSIVCPSPPFPPHQKPCLYSSYGPYDPETTLLIR